MPTSHTESSEKRQPEWGSSLLIAIFVLLLLSSLGIALLFLSTTERRMGTADLRGKQAYYLAEAGLEDGRSTLTANNIVSADPRDYAEELITAAGGNPTIDFNPNAVGPIYDADGNLTGLTGIGDDTPLRSLTALGKGQYAAFLTNDKVDGYGSTTDTNDRVMITGVGSGTDGSFEVVQAVVERRDLFPNLPATITIVGETTCNPAADCADFDGGNSNAKEYNGNDADHCPGGDPSLSVPVVGVFGTDSVGTASDGVTKPMQYVSDAGTVVDLSGDPGLDAMFSDCDEMVAFAQVIKDNADVVGDSSLPLASLGTPGNPKIVFIDGDYAIPASVDGAGLILCTGELSIHGGTNWQGPVFAVGKGDFIRNGAGNGDILGALVVADVAGPDRVLFTSDDCSGQDGVSGTSDDGFAQATYEVPGAGSSTTAYCSTYLKNLQGLRPPVLLSFRQY